MKKLLFWGPVLTASGYGEHARQLLRALIAQDKYDISVCGVKWGNTPFIDDNDDLTLQIKLLQNKYLMEKQVNTQYDIAIQVTIPNEFQKLGRLNIGVTAGIEVDRVSPDWIIKANEVCDLIVVPSKHSAQTYSQVSYRGENGEELSLKKPILVAPEGFDSSVFNMNRDHTNLKSIPDDIEPDFNFLSVGLGLDKPVGEDRKNIGLLVKWFCETFAGNPKVGLVLKTSIVNNSLIDFETTKSRIQKIKEMTGCGEFPKIKLVHGRLSKSELAMLYKHPKIKAYITLTHGEGFGLPILEAAACGLPVVATNWSGHTDFLTVHSKKKFVDIEYDLTEIPASAVWNGVMERGSRWASPKEVDAKMKMKKVSLSIDKPTEWARELGGYLAEKYSEKKLSTQFLESLDQFIEQRNSPHDIVVPDSVKQGISQQLGILPGDKTLLYTMPMSAGDVFISTAVVDSLKRKYPDHKIFFATDSKYTSILKENKDITQVIQFDQWMMNVPLCEKIFTEVYTPNLAVQMNTSNWVHGGKGRLLANEIAAQCGVELGEYSIKTEEVMTLPKKFIAFHPGSGKGQHEARNYRHWKKVVHNLKKQLPGYEVVTVGQEGDIHFEGCVDLRGQTTYNQLAYVIQKASCLVGIDSVSMHLAAAVGIPHVALFGSSYSTSTGPVYKFDVPHVLIDTPNRMGCEKACYKYQCVVDRESPCLNEIDPKRIVKEVLGLLNEDKPFHNQWEEVAAKIAGYTHVFNAETHGFPYIESIKSMLGFCDEVVIVDGGSTDGTVEKIRAIGDDRVKIHERKWDWTEPGMDGMQKAFGRAMCSVGQDDFLWQQDADEVVHEEDYPKIKKLAERFPSDTDLIHLPVVELWGSSEDVRTDRHSWKWRMSRNNFRITHGINKDARVFDEKTGRTYAKKGMSDGCEYIDVMTGEFIQHKGFYNQQLEIVRRQNPEAYGKAMNKIFSDLPVVYHYSWADLHRKVKNFKEFWNKCWSNLYNDPNPVDRFPDVQTGEDMVKKVIQLKNQRGEHEASRTFKLQRSNPSIMKKWLQRIDDDSRHLHDYQKQATPVEVNAGVS